MGNHQAYRGRAIGQWEHTQMPAGAELRVDGDLRAFIRPVADLGARAGALRNIDVHWAAVEDPPIPGKRQRRTLDAPAQQPVTEIVVKTPYSVEIKRMLINPYDLHDLLRP